MNTNTKSTADIIADQIGARAFFMMGTRIRVGNDKDQSLSFDIRGCRRANSITITLNDNDTYKIEFFKTRGVDRKLVGSSMEDVQVGQLHSLISEFTGLALSI